MYTNFKEKAIEYVKEAIAEDNAGDYQKAFDLYKVALEYFSTHLRYERNPRAREAITLKFKEYLERAEFIKGLLDGHHPMHPPAAYGTGNRGQPPYGPR